ncbi:MULTISPECIES: hypothetical protein [Vibrio]|uniref:hypothetical protein n=1 Tax=Vibrio TaxID=662 RepID=UPI001EFC9D0C|nr:hypothetical protein [Vibrio natriegens]MCG9702647.1 hypothetical protein [Vibrio natriegens]MEE3877091.1 hypothetical protein [Vibrio sp. YYF0003]
MTKVFKWITTLAFLFSVNAMASSPIEAVSIESSAQTLNSEQVRVVLDKWKANELSKIDSIRMIQFQHDGAPIGAREEMARYMVERKYQAAITQLNM